MKSCWFSALVLMLAVSVVGQASNAKLIALTFDDGPRPQVLFSQPVAQSSVPGLVDVLDRNQAKATFFVMAWRLKPGAYPESDKARNGLSCREAARELVRRGHEIENHTYSHLPFPLAETRKGEAWILADVERASTSIKAVTGTWPRFVRPPDWQIGSELQQRLESRGYRLMTLSSRAPLAFRDVNSEDYLCAGSNVSRCPKPSLVFSLLGKIAQRERAGVFTHILVLHELPVSVALLEALLPALRARGYRFVRLDQYMEALGAD